MQIIPGVYRERPGMSIFYNEITAPFWVLADSVSLSESFPLDEVFALDVDLGSWFFSDLFDDPDGGYIDRLEKANINASVRAQVFNAQYGR